MKNNKIYVEICIVAKSGVRTNDCWNFKTLILNENLVNKKMIHQIKLLFYRDPSSTCVPQG